VVLDKTAGSGILPGEAGGLATTACNLMLPSLRACLVSPEVLPLVRSRGVHRNAPGICIHGWRVYALLGVKEDSVRGALM